MTESIVTDCAGVEAPKADRVELLSAVRANLTGLLPYYDGKRVYQKNMKALFPSVNQFALKRRLKRSPCNWRFHEAVKKVIFDANTVLVELQCQAVLENFVDEDQKTFLLPSDEAALAERVKVALAGAKNADDGAEVLENWVTMSSWARDAALADGSGIDIPESWLDTMDSQLWVSRFLNRIDIDEEATGFDWIKQMQFCCYPRPRNAGPEQCVVMRSDTDDEEEQARKSAMHRATYQPTPSELLAAIDAPALPFRAAPLARTTDASAPPFEPAPPVPATYNPALEFAAAPVVAMRDAPALPFKQASVTPAMDAPAMPFSAPPPALPFEPAPPAPATNAPEPPTLSEFLAAATDATAMPVSAAPRAPATDAPALPFEPAPPAPATDAPELPTLSEFLAAVTDAPALPAVAQPVKTAREPSLAVNAPSKKRAKLEPVERGKSIAGPQVQHTPLRDCSNTM